MSGFSDPAHDVNMRLRKLEGKVQTLQIELSSLRSETVPACFQCGEQIAFQAQVYRCADCGAPFHKGCIKHHFENEIPCIREEPIAWEYKSVDGWKRISLENYQILKGSSFELRPVLGADRSGT